MIAALLCVSFTGCFNIPDIVQNGIVVDNGNTDDDSGNDDDSGKDDVGGGTAEEPPQVKDPVIYSDETLGNAENLLYGAAEEAINSIRQNALSATQKADLRNVIGSRILPVFGARGIAETDFLSALDVLEEYLDDLQNIIAAAAKQQALTLEEYQSVKTIFGQLASLFGMDLTARLGYDFCICYFDYYIDRYTQRYEKYGYAYYLDYIADYTRKKADFMSEIGEENFVILARLVYAGSDIFDGAGGGAAAQLTDGELCAYFRAQSDWLSRLCLSAEGWATAFECIVALADNQLATDLFAEAEETGDLLAFSSLLGNVADAVAGVLSNVTEQAASSLRGGDTELFYCSLAAGLDDDGWQAFGAALAALFPDGGNYRQILAEHGLDGAYSDYMSGATPGTLQEVRAAALSQSGFFAAVQAYVNAVSPVAAFLWYGL